MHRLLTLSSVHSLRNRRFVAGKHRYQVLGPQSSFQVYSFGNLTTTRVEAEDQSLTAEPRVSEKLRKVYTRDFLLSFMMLDTCKELPGGVDLLDLWKPKYSYGRDVLLSLTGLEVCKRLPRRFNHILHSDMIADAYGSSILGNPSAKFSRDSKNSGFSSWSSKWDSGESGQSSDGKSDRNSPTEAKTNSDNGNDCQAYYQLAKSSNPYRPPHSSKVESTEGIEVYIYPEKASNSAGCQIKKRAGEDKTGVCTRCSWKKEPQTFEENQDKWEEKHDPVTVHISEDCEGQNKKSVDLIVKADIRHKTQTPAVHSPKCAWRSQEEGTSEVYRCCEGFDSKQTPATFSQRDELSSKIMTKLSPSAENGAPKQLYVRREVAKSHGGLACEQQERSISSNSERSSCQHQYRSQPDAHHLVHSEGNDNTSGYSSSLPKGVASCKHEPQSSTKHFLVKNGSSVPHLSPAGNRGKLWVIKDSIRNEDVPSVQGGSSDKAEPGGFQFSAGEDNISTSTADECGSSGIVSGCSKDVVQSAIDDDWGEIVSMIQAEQEIEHRTNRDVALQSAFDEDWAEIVSMIQAERELEHRALAERHKLLVDEICLPDEDSLIVVDECLMLQKPDLTPVQVPETQREQEPELCTVVTQDESSLEYCLPDEDSLITCDDLLAPQNLVSLPGGCSTKHEAMSADVTVCNSNEPPTESVVQKDEQSPLSGSHGVTGQQGCQQNSPQTSNSESNPRTPPSSDTSDSRQPQTHSRTKTMNPNSHRPAPKRHFDAQSRHSGRRYGLPMIEPSFYYPVLWPPLVFPHLHHEMLNGPALSTYVAPVPPSPYSNSLELLPLNHPQPGYEVYRMHTPGPYGGSKCNNRSSGKRIL